MISSWGNLTTVENRQRYADDIANADESKAKHDELRAQIDERRGPVAERWPQDTVRL